MKLFTKVIYFVIINSIFINVAISSDDDKDFGTMTLCINNSTKGNTVYEKYQWSASSLLSNLALEPIPPVPRFFTTYSGLSRGKAYSSYICWGDISSQLCKKCVNHATQALLNQDFYLECYAIGYYLDSGLCLVHYSYTSVNEYKNGSVFSMGNIGGKVADYLPYNRTLSTTIEGLIKEAKVGNWTKTNLATRVVPVMGSSRDKIHILVQCIPVISATNCSRCLRELYDFVPTSCNGTQGGVVVHPDCILKFSNQSFIGGVYGRSSPSYLHGILVMLFFLHFVILI